MTANTCRCGQPAPDATICTGCESRLRAALREVPKLTAEHETVLTRQAKQGGQSVGYVTGSTETRLPFDPKASEAAGELKAQLVSWARLVADQNARAPRLPPDSTAALAGWLCGQLPWLRLHDAAADAVEELCAAVEGVRRAVYRNPQERHYRGPCLQEFEVDDDPTVHACCVADLYVRSLDVDRFTCRHCGSSHTSRGRRDWLIETAGGQVMTQAELLVLLGNVLDVRVTQSTMASWIRRGRLVATNPPRPGEPEGVTRYYRVADALMLIGSRLAA